MPEYLLERYVSRTDPSAVEAGATRARTAAAELRRAGRPVRFVRSIFVPADETCFDLFEAGSPEDVRETALRAGLRFERLAEASTLKGAIS